MSRALVALLILFAVAAGLPAAHADLPDTLARPAGAVTVPEHFLRSWDPVTVFFDADTGPKSGGPEDDPGRFVTMSPAQPGAFTWLDARTLQFRPAEPWPALARFSFRVAGRDQTLVTLLPAPTNSSPSNGADMYDPVDSIRLDFSERVEPAVLARVTKIELRPLPGLDGPPQRVLDSGDFEVKALEEMPDGVAASYLLRLREPIANGMRALLRFALSPETTFDGLSHEIAFTTATPFRVTRLGCSFQYSMPITASGITYDPANAMRCSSSRVLNVTFSAPVDSIGPIEARNLVHVSPPVDKLTFTPSGYQLVIYGDFASDTLYTLRVAPSALKDRRGRSLELSEPSQLTLFFPAAERFLRWQASQGIVERDGPQMLPLEGRGFDRLDLRIHRVDPLNRSFWPFPDNAVATSDADAPPGPGEEPERIAGVATRQIKENEIAEHLKALGSPSISEIVSLPLRKAGGAARFGLDLKPYLERIAGTGQPGTYLVGVRRLDAAAERSWMRVQVTDLSLTTVEEPTAVRFFVNSLKTGLPIADATVRLEGVRGTQWAELARGLTGNDGQFSWQAPGAQSPSVQLRRLVVTKGSDTLVLDPAHPPPSPGAGDRQDVGEAWLQWAFQTLTSRVEVPQLLCHIFTERPIYRPEDGVHVKAWARSWRGGSFTPFRGKASLVVTGDEQAEWRYPLDFTAEGTAYHHFAEDTAATGPYEAHLEINGQDCGSVEFKKEAYRLPRFEALLHVPQRTPLDATFTVDLAARYYAGGVVTGRPVRWRVTQQPYDWRPTRRDGWAFSSDARFSSLGQFRSTAVLEREAELDQDGNAKLELDPTIEPTAQPRRYIVEATVTGEDDVTVTTTEQVIALPPFALGLKVPRYLEKADRIEAQLLAIGVNEENVAGLRLTARLLRREWHSTLQATDFTQGTAKYVTDVVDEKIAEIQATTAADPVPISFPIDRAGVYIVELEAQDRTGRSQKLAVDLFANGDTPVVWARQPAAKLELSTDKPAYAPGETATIVVQSPYQQGEALVILEHADGHNAYQWASVANGAARLSFTVDKKDMPKLPVHVVLMRGRVATPSGQALADLGRPATVTGSTMLKVTPVQHKVQVALAYPEKAQPADEIDVTVKLSDEQGQPLSGEVTLWLVDQAVLSLAVEQRLDPLPDFIVERESRIALRDTRNLTLGLLPLQEVPGGDGNEDANALLDKATVRKNFTPVPYYNPRLMVGPSGTATVKVKLPDSLTNFKLRAKVVSGPDRFGFGTGQIAVRLPVIVEPALPRFLRHGDRFTASAIGRIVEGEGGPGRAQLRVDGLTLKAASTQSFEWEKTPQRIDIPLEVPSPGWKEDGTPERDQVKLTFGVERIADHARDAFEVTLPLKPDRRPERRRQLAELKAGAPFTLPAISEAYRPGTLKRSLTLASEPALVRLAAGLDYLREYPFGCTEQRVSLTRAEVAGRRLRDLVVLDRGADRTEKDLAVTTEWVKGAIDANGLVAFWPGSRGKVTLTAWTAMLLAEARDGGFAIDQPLLDGLIKVLKQALRSDFANFIGGAELAERSWALVALATAGEGDPGYAAELARRSQMMTLESRAQVAYALGKAAKPEPVMLASLGNELWAGIVFRLQGGQESYGGLQANALTNNPLLLPSETRTLAQVIRATAPITTDNRRRLVVDALVGSAGDSGWGNTNANAEAFLALSDYFVNARQAERRATLATGGRTRTLVLAADSPIARTVERGAEAISLTTAGETLALLTDTSFVGASDGSTVAARAEGFAVTQTIRRVGPNTALPLDGPAKRVDLAIGEVIEHQVEVVNPADRHQVAITIPLAAGLEPLNPALATAPPEATPSFPPSLAPSYVAFLDDEIRYFYDSLPKGTYRFAFRSRGGAAGRFVLPPAGAEMMYDGRVSGNGNGAEVVIERR